MIVQYTDAYTGHLAQGVTQLNYMNMGSKGNKFFKHFCLKVYNISHGNAYIWKGQYYQLN